jgi:hypothetical protein
MAAIRFVNSFRAAIAALEREKRVMPPFPVAPNREKLSTLSLTLSLLHCYIAISWVYFMFTVRAPALSAP